jgi:hypothetical protein
LRAPLDPDASLRLLKEEDKREDWLEVSKTTKKSHEGSAEPSGVQDKIGRISQVLICQPQSLTGSHPMGRVALT